MSYNNSFLKNTFKIYNIENLQEYTDYFSLKSSSKIYRVYINFCKMQGITSSQSTESFLHDEEIKYLEKLIYERRINSYLLGRYSAKKAVSALVGENNLKSILIRNGVFNQPLAYYKSYCNIQISLSHCEDFAATVAFNDALIVGIDIEKNNQHFQRGLELELTQNERNLSYKVSFNYEDFLLVIKTLNHQLCW